MIESFGIEKDQVAKWAGITTAAFSISQSVTAILWGRVSDHFGRKPAIITGLLCTMVCSLIWGCSSSLSMAITARAIQGAVNGNVGTIRTMVAEMVSEKELQPTAFSIMPLVWTLGSIFGPSFGGFFAKPAEHMSGLFGHNTFFIKFPFALPNIIASFLFLIGISTAILFLRETHHGMRHRKDYGLIIGKRIVLFLRTIFNPSPASHARSARPCFTETSPLLAPSTSSSSPNGKHSTKRPSRPTLSQVFAWQSIINLVSYTFLAMHSVAYDQLLPIFMHSPIVPPPRPLPAIPLKFTGGFGFNSSRIGTLFSIYGIFGGLVQFLIFPAIARRFGVLNCYKGCAIAFPLIYFVTPYMALIQSSVWQQAVVLIIMTLKCVAVIFAFPCSMIMLTNSANSLSILGTLNGFAVTFSSVGRAIGPAASGAAYTWGVNKGYAIAPWWLLGLLAGIGALPVWWLVDGDGPSHPEPYDSEDLASDTEEEGPLLVKRRGIYGGDGLAPTYGGPRDISRDGQGRNHN